MMVHVTLYLVLVKELLSLVMVDLGKVRYLGQFLTQMVTLLLQVELHIINVMLL